MSVDILPDCRTTVVRGVTRSPMGNLVQIYCANCGTHMGMVNEKQITFAFALCQPCADVFGHDAHFYQEPDAEFFARCAHELAEAEITTPEEVATAVEAGGNPIATLAAEWNAKMRRIT